MNPFTVAVAPFIFLSIGAIALFSFLAVAAWSGARSEERKAYYKNDMLKRLAESPEPTAAATLQYLRDEEISRQKHHARQHRQGIQLGGLITTAIGIALMVFLGALVHHHSVYLVGLIPLLIGIALLIYVQLFAPR